MKIICTTEKYLDEKTSCEKEYCCKKMKKAMNKLSTGLRNREYVHSDFSMTDDKIRIQTHSGYDHDSHHEDINYCPWCGVELKVEHVKVDNTGLPPIDLRKPEKAPKKKKHWWSCEKTKSVF